jgi:hypothetical protein
MNDRVFSREYFADALVAIGRKGVRVHDLRHFSGTQTARQSRGDNGQVGSLHTEGVVDLSADRVGSRRRGRRGVVGTRAGAALIDENQRLSDTVGVRFVRLTGQIAALPSRLPEDTQ